MSILHFDGCGCIRDTDHFPGMATINGLDYCEGCHWECEQCGEATNCPDAIRPDGYTRCADCESDHEYRTHDEIAEENYNAMRREDSRHRSPLDLYVSNLNRSMRSGGVV